VRASRNQGMRGRMPGFDGTAAETGTTNLRIVLPNDGGITGKVAFADGTIPTQFTVGIGFANEPVTSKDGSFTLDQVAPQKYQLTRCAAPSSTPGPSQITVEEGKVADAGDIVVKKGRAIAGRVTLKGQPVVGATVYAGRQIFGTGSSNSAAFGGPPGRAGNKETVTDEEGKFRLTGLGPAPLAVVAEHPDFGRSAALRVVRGSPNELTLELVVAGWGVLTGKVTDADGPAADTIVSAQSVSTPNAMYSVVSGADGTFRFDKLAPDTYKVSAMLGTPMRGMTFYSKQVKVDTTAPATVDLTVDKGAITVSVTATADNGTVEGGAAWLLTGTITAANADELGLAAALQTSGTSTFGVMFGGRPATIINVRPGDYSLCVTVLPPGLGMQGMQYFTNHAADLPVKCKMVKVTAAPTEQSFTVATTLPALVPDP
jgi:hypothetical protein